MHKIIKTLLINIKLYFFFFILLPLLVIPNFFFSFSQSSLVENPPSSIDQSKDDGRIKKSVGNYNLWYLFYTLLFGAQKIKHWTRVEGGNWKKFEYSVDLLADAITQLMLEQGKTLYDVDWDKMKGPPRQQLFNLLNTQGKLKHKLVINRVNSDNRNNWGDKYLNSLRSLLLKMQILGITQVSHPSSKLSVEFSELNKISVATLKALDWEQVITAKKDGNSDFSSFSQDVQWNFLLTFGLEYKTALTFSINKTWTPWLKTLQKARGLGLTHLTVGEVQVDVSTLVDSKVEEASDLSLEQLKTLKKLEPRHFPKLDANFNFIKPLFLKLKVLGFSKVSHPGWKSWNAPRMFDELSDVFLKLNKISVATLKALHWWQLITAKKDGNSDFYSFFQNNVGNLELNFGTEIKDFLTFSINKTWTPWLKTLQKARGLGLIYLTVAKEQVDVSSLVDSKVEEASDLSLEQLQTLKKLEPLGFKNLQTQMQTQIENKLSFFKINFEKYKTDDQRIAIFQKNWRKNSKKHYFIWASIFGVETVVLDSVGASYAYAEIAYYNPPQTLPNSLYYLWITKDQFKTKSDGSTYKAWFSDLGWVKFENDNFGKFLNTDDKQSKDNFVMIYKITDFISEIRKIVKTKNKDLSTLDINFTQLQGKARKQLLAILDGNGNLRSGIWNNIDTQIQNDLGQKYLNSLKPLLFKIQTLRIWDVSHSSLKGDYNFSFLTNYDLSNAVFMDFCMKMKLIYNNLEDFYYLTGAVTSVINKTWTPWLKTLQKVSGLGFTHVTVNKERIDVSSLVDSNVEEASDLSLEQLKTLKKLEPLTLSKLQTLIDSHESLKKVISNDSQQEKKLETKNKSLVIGLSVAGGVLTLSALGGGLYWFLKIKK